MLEYLLLLSRQWVEDMITFSMTNRDKWSWTLMIMQPKEVSPGLVKEEIEPNKLQIGLLPSALLGINP